MSIGKEGLNMGYDTDCVLLCGQIGSQHLVSNDAGEVSVLSGCNVTTGLKPVDGSPVTALCSHGKFIYFATHRKVWRVVNERVLNPLKVEEFCQVGDMNVTALAVSAVFPGQSEPEGGDQGDILILGLLDGKILAVSRGADLKSYGGTETP